MNGTIFPFKEIGGETLASLLATLKMRPALVLMTLLTVFNQVLGAAQKKIENPNLPPSCEKVPDQFPPPMWADHTLWANHLSAPWIVEGLHSTATIRIVHVAHCAHPIPKGSQKVSFDHS